MCVSGCPSLENKACQGGFCPRVAKLQMRESDTYVYMHIFISSFQSSKSWNTGRLPPKLYLGSSVKASKQCILSCFLGKSLSVKIVGEGIALVFMFNMAAK